MNPPSEFPGRIRPRAFTLVELCIGMMVTGFIGLVLASFATATAQQWRHADQQQHLDITAQQAGRLVGSVIQSARSIGHVFDAPSPAIFLWQTDDLTREGVAQLGEMSLIEYDSATESVYLYQPDNTYNLAGDTLAVKAVTDADMSNYAVVQLFKLQPWLKPTRVLLGPGRAVDEASPLTRVVDCAFNAVSNPGIHLPVVSFNVTLSRAGQSLDVTDRFALRVPTTQAVVTTDTVTGN